MKLPSGSKLELASICAPSVVLPGVDSTSAPAVRGTAFHDFLYNVAQEGIPAALEKAPEEYRANLAALDFDRLPLDPAQYAGEVAFAYGVKTGKARELGRGIGREAAKALCTPDEMMGTADVVSLGDDWVTVLDYKTGWTDYGPIKANWQLSFYALCAARAFGVEKARIGIIRIREDGSCFFDLAELDFFDLEDVAFRLAAVVDAVRQAHEAKAAGAPLALREGAHCKRCPAMSQCPAMVTLMRELVEQGDGSTLAILTPESAPIIFERMRAARAALERVEMAMEAWAAINPIPLTSGQVYGRHKLPRDVFVPEVAVDIIRREFGDAFTNRAVDITPRVTKEGIKRALRFQAQTQKGLKVDPVFRALQDRLREAGGLTTKFTYPVMVHKPKALDDSADEGTAPSTPESAGSTAHA